MEDGKQQEGVAHITRLYPFMEKSRLKQEPEPSGGGISL